jgi:hypothetical protein
MEAGEIEVFIVAMLYDLAAKDPKRSLSCLILLFDGASLVSVG